MKIKALKKINALDMVHKIRDKRSLELIALSDEEIVAYFHERSGKKKKHNIS